jgi:hypothetical protein
MAVIEMRNKVTLFMIVLFYGVKLFHIHLKINYNGCITVGSGLLALQLWLETVISGAPLLLYKSELTINCQCSPPIDE